MNDFITLTDLGKLYGVSSHQAGKWLKNLGLRTPDGKPSEDAFKTGMVKTCPSTQPGTFFYVWNRRKATEVLDGMQYPRVVHDSEQRECWPADL